MQNRVLSPTFIYDFLNIFSEIARTFVANTEDILQTRGQPATIIPGPARMPAILQGSYFPEVSHSVLK